MSQHAGAHGRLTKLQAWIARASADRRGVAAVEFALVAPLLLCMYFVTMEVSQAIETNKKVSRVGNMVADLVTQQSTTTKSELNAILAIGQSLLTPYYRSKPTITITAIEITNEATPEVKVFWSRMLKEDGTTDVGLAKDTIVTVPATQNVPGSFLIRVDSELTYLPVIAWAASGEQPMPGLTATFSQLAMKERYYYRPRMSTQIDCPDC